MGVGCQVLGCATLRNPLSTFNLQLERVQSYERVIPNPFDFAQGKLREESASAELAEVTSAGELNPFLNFQPSTLNSQPSTLKPQLPRHGYCCITCDPITFWEVDQSV
jgi:hypothetical protein